ncbi:hypothetical protein [Leadbettera azotonutricia]|uniref:Lipocalin-like domain-containing protein n=1 Tax=Leadbettera azotonutricia (strain ATCC BAA-888 / DSM 13862 / ZAS-9) TaxID=545695 RepID=F5Y722_LEAAZ|nr:hypothetical protein [Leadbettera azotonutricia]AEF82491.1 hypothetical protein TREAZ_1174 [Leadbettera azotonutricia ZAS-9]
MKQRTVRRIFPLTAGCIFCLALTANLAAAPAAEKAVSSNAISSPGMFPGNPFIGVWQAGDAVYNFTADGNFTTVSTHCCGLRFLDEYSYYIYKDTLITYGALMGGSPNIKQYSFAVLNTGAIKVTSGGGTEWLYSRLSEIPHELIAREEDFFGYAPEQNGTNPFAGKWNVEAGNLQSRGAKSLEFRTDGTASIRSGGGRSTESCYLVREDGLALITLKGKTPLIQEYTFEAQKEGITVNEKETGLLWAFLKKGN